MFGKQWCVLSPSYTLPPPPPPALQVALITLLGLGSQTLQTVLWCTKATALLSTALLPVRPIGSSILEARMGQLDHGT